MIICNKCGRKLEEDAAAVVLEDFVAIRKEWGYFSKKDGTVWELTLCENCFSWLEGELVVPIKKTNKSELL